MLLKNLILTCLRYWQNKLKTQFLERLDHGSEKELHPKLKLAKFNNQKSFDDIAKNSTDFYLKKKDNFYATMNLLIS